MRQLTFVEPNKIEWWDVPAPQLTHARDAVVEPLVVARCDLDLYITIGAFAVPGPFALGHETVARVIEVGSQVRHVLPGDVVIFPFQVSCGACPRCLRGHTNACTTVPFRSSFGLAGIHGHEWGGGLSDRLKVPFADHMLRKLPAGCDPLAVVGAADNVTDGYRAVQPALAKFPGADVLVIGGLAQSCGLYAAMAARALTAGRVLYLDASAERRALAANLGVETGPLPASADGALGEFPVTVEASATQLGLTLAVGATAPNGICTCLAGGVEPEQQIPRMAMFGRGVTLDISRANIAPLLERVVDDICAERLRPLQIARPPQRFDDALLAMSEPDAKLVFVRDSSLVGASATTGCDRPEKSRSSAS